MRCCGTWQRVRKARDFLVDRTVVWVDSRFRRTGSCWQWGTRPMAKFTSGAWLSAKEVAHFRGPEGSVVVTFASDDTPLDLRRCATQRCLVWDRARGAAESCPGQRRTGERCCHRGEFLPCAPCWCYPATKDLLGSTATFKNPIANIVQLGRCAAIRTDLARL